MAKMFGTNGVRGVVNQDMNVQLALQMGKAIGACFPGIIAIANDTRVSSDMISMAVISGMTSVGCDVRNLGMIPTPALQYYVKTHSEVVAGVMITASHNPPEFNGIKVVAGDGTEASPEQEAAVEDRYDTVIPGVTWDRVGTVRNISGAGEDYVDAIVAKVDVEKIRSANLTAVVDCANGASCFTTPLLMKKLGVRAVALNASARGEFPGHPSEPTEDNLSDLIRLVKEVRADIGVAHDGDADRCVFIDNKGTFIPGDVTLALLSRFAVIKNRGGEVVTPIATSSIIDDVVSKAGGTVVRTAVGAPKVARRMMRDNAVFGGEENGGLIFPDHQYCRDGGMAIGCMLEAISDKKVTLRKIIETLPVYHTSKRKIECNQSYYPEIRELLRKNIGNGTKDETDGIKITFVDGWVLARPSGTEPLYRVYAESEDPVVAKKYADAYENLIREFLATKGVTE